MALVNPIYLGKIALVNVAYLLDMAFINPYYKNGNHYKILPAKRRGGDERLYQRAEVAGSIDEYGKLFGRSNKKL